MDFYDDFYEGKKRRKKRSSILGYIFSGMIGGLIVLLLVPSLVNSGVIDLTPKQENIIPPNSEQNQTNPSENQTSQINVDINSGIVDSVDKVKPAVVGVVNIQQQRNIFNRQTTDVDAGVGTGFVFDKKDGKAYIVTNEHVISGAKDIEVSLANGDRVPAELLGSDALTDLAVIAIEEKYVDSIAPLGDSTTLKTGEPAIAIGNPLGLEFSQSVTVGVISSNNRTIAKDLNQDGLTDWETEVIQTDAAINPGNSGGPLVNINGEVIGINSAKIADSGVEGLGFAIPISDAKPVIDDLIKHGKVPRPYMGVSLFDLHNVSEKDRTEVLKLPAEIKNGVVLNEVSQFGPAGLAGLEKYDVIVKLDDQALTTSADLRKYMYTEKKVGDKMKVTFYRDGKLQTTTMTLTEVPNEYR